MSVKALHAVNVIGLAVIGLMPLCACTKVGPAVSAEKRIIAFAPDVVDAFYLSQNIVELEKLPIDGLIIAVHPKLLADGQFHLGRTSLPAGIHERDDYQQVIAALKATKFERFTDNFIDCPVAAQNKYDWFDDRWSQYTENAATLAYIAKQVGFKGLVLDVEQYGGMNVSAPFPFGYDYRKDRSQRSFEQVAAQVRKRGREMTEAIVAEYSDITIIMIPGLGWTDAPEKSLLSAFVDGVLEGSGPHATLVDGLESGYPVMLQKHFVELRRYAQQNGVRKSLVPDLYASKVKYGMGVWIDFDARFNGTYNGWHTDPNEFEANYRSPRRLEQSLYNALTAADRYVWLFAIHPQVWWRPDLVREDQLDRQRAIAGTGWSCRLCPHLGIPQAYLEAIRTCRTPHDPQWAPENVRNMELEAMRGWCAMLVKSHARKPESLKGPNILANGDVEVWNDGMPDRWQAAETHKKFVSSEDTIVRNGARSIKVSSQEPVRWIYVTQTIPAAAYTGKTIILGVWTKSDLPQAGSINIIDFVETEGRKDEVGSKFTSFDAGDGWYFKSIVKTIRQHATHISFYLDSSFPVPGSIYYDAAVAVVVE